MEVAPRLRRGSSSLDVPAIGESPRQRHGSSSLAMPVFFSGPPTTEDKELLAKKERVNFIAAHSLAAGTVAEAQGSVLALNISTWNVKRKVFRSVKGRYRNIWVSVFLKSKATGDKYREVGRRECMSRPSQPHATCTVDIAYNFEQMQTLKFVCYDPKTSSSDEEDEIADQHVSVLFSFLPLTYFLLFSFLPLRETLCNCTNCDLAPCHSVSPSNRRYRLHLFLCDIMGLLPPHICNKCARKHTHTHPHTFYQRPGERNSDWDSTHNVGSNDGCVGRLGGCIEWCQWRRDARQNIRQREIAFR